MFTNRRRAGDRQQIAFMGASMLCDVVLVACAVGMLAAIAILILKNDAQTAALATVSEQLRALKSSVNTLHRRIDTLPGVNDGHSQSFQQRQERRPRAEWG